MVEFAEDIGHYWKTSRTSPDIWLARATAQIEEAGGTVQQEAFGRAGDRAAFMISFTVAGEFYKLIWPVLPSKTGDERAARIQAATMLYRDVKARCMSAKVLGVRAAFFNFLLLADGRTAGEVATPELPEMVPKLLREPGTPPPESSDAE